MESLILKNKFYFIIPFLKLDLRDELINIVLLIGSSDLLLNLCM